MKKLIIYTDGGARGNPGPAALGVVIYDDQGNNMLRYGQYLGKQTNNYAEYMAVISGLEKARSLEATHVSFKCDSKLVVEQLNRNWKVKEPSIQTLFIRAWNLMQEFRQVTFSYIPRAENTLADAEVNKSLDEHHQAHTDI